MIYFVLIFVQVLFGLNVSASKIVLADIDPLLWNLIRLVLSTLILFIYSFFTRRKFYIFTGRDILFKLLPLSFIGFVLAPNLFLYGLKESTALNAAIISTTIPLMTLVLSMIFGDEHLNLLRILGFLCGMFGVYTLSGGENFSLDSGESLGDLLLFIGCFCVASYFVLTKKIIAVKDHIWTTLYMFTLGIIGTGVCYLIFHFGDKTQVNYSEVTILAGLFSVAFGTVLAYLLNNWSLTKMKSSDVSLFVYMQPIVVGLIGVMYYGEVISLKLVISSLLIFVGVILSGLSHSQKIRNKVAS